MNKKFLYIILLCTWMMCGCGDDAGELQSEKYMENSGELQNDNYTENADELQSDKYTENVTVNPFFFPMDKDKIEIDVACELNVVCGTFRGNGILRVERLQEGKLENYYAVSLTDLKGVCSEHGNINDSYCEIYSSFNWYIGYFYVDRDEIYMMLHEKEYLQIFKDIEEFPPDPQYIEEWESVKRDRGDHYGYFGYRLVCSEQGFEDTYQTLSNTGDVEDTELDGKLYSKDYHNSITANGDIRRYALYPVISTGTREYEYITWEKGQGIAVYENWSGNFKNFISFWIIRDN